jgi:23S rRNA-/tRNA-specific pseudouridylate synthase
VHPTSRLDRGVSGVVVIALSKRAAERMARARVEGTYARRYVAIAESAPQQGSGTWDTPLGRARDPRLRAPQGRDAVPALTRFAVVAHAGTRPMLALSPVTGRTHQLRVHAAHAGAPLLGDRAYGGPTRVVLEGGRVIPLGRIALHAARVTVPSARASIPLVAISPIPCDLSQLWLALGGDPSAWDIALSCALDS